MCLLGWTDGCSSPWTVMVTGGVPSCTVVWCWCRSFCAALQGLAGFSNTSSWRKAPIISEDDNSIAFLGHGIKALPSYVLGTDKKIWIMENAPLMKTVFLLGHGIHFDFTVGYAERNSWLYFARVQVYLSVLVNDNLKSSFPQSLLFS